MLEAQTKAEKELLDKQHAQAMAKLKKQQEYEQQLLQQQYEQEQKLLQQQQKKTTSTANHSTIVQANRAQQMQAQLTGYYGAQDVLDKMVADNYTKAQIINVINEAQKAGEITANEARELKRIYAPSGMTY